MLIENAEVGVIPPDGNGRMLPIDLETSMEEVQADLNALGIPVERWDP